MDFQKSSQSLFNDQDFSCIWFDSVLDDQEDLNEPLPVLRKPSSFFNTPKVPRVLESYYESEVEVLEHFSQLSYDEKR